MDFTNAENTLEGRATAIPSTWQAAERPESSAMREPRRPCRHACTAASRSSALHLACFVGLTLDCSKEERHPELMTLPQRSRLAHIPPVEYRDQPIIVFLTVCVRNRRPLLANETAHECLRAAWTQADRWQVGRYMIMPDHAHILCAPADPATGLRTWVECWRWCVTRNWATPSEKPIWQKDFWDTQLRRGESYSAKWEYIRQNPVRRGLVKEADDWPYQGEMCSLRWTER